MKKTSDIRRMIIDQSDRAYLCVDSSKFGANSFVSICNFDALTGLITDHIPSEEWRTFLSKSGLSTYAYDELDTAAPLASPAEGSRQNKNRNHEKEPGVCIRPAPAVSAVLD